MDFFNNLLSLLGGHPQHQQPQTHQNNAPTLNVRSAPSMPTDPNMQQHMAAGQPIDPRRYARFNIPVGQSIPQSAMDQYDPQTRKMAEIYQSNPQDSRVSHIDPAIFGYAPDDGVQMSRNYNMQPFNPTDMTIQGYNQNDLSNGIQGGTVNQGNIPLQNSGFGGPGYTANLQPTISADFSQNPNKFKLPRY